MTADDGVITMSANRYDKMTADDFDRILREIIDELSTSELLSIPGVYEAVSEEFNNEVLSRWETRS